VFSLFTFPLFLLIQLLSFACSWFKLLFVDHTMMFVALEGMIGFLFRKGVDVVAYLTAQAS
jgi:hypothetical protein